jgi:hypothetical protein
MTGVKYTVFYITLILGVVYGCGCQESTVKQTQSELDLLVPTPEATSVPSDTSSITPVTQIGHFEGWFAAVEDVDGDRVEEVILWNRLEKTTYQYKWTDNQFKLISKLPKYESHRWEEFPNPHQPTEEELAIPASMKEQLPSGSKIASKLEADIDGDGVDELVTLAGHSHSRLPDHFVNVQLLMFKRGAGPSSEKYFLTFILELSDWDSLMEKGNTFALGSIRFCNLKDTRTKQLVVFWTEVYGSGHSTVCDVFNVSISKNPKKISLEQPIL